MRTCLILLLSCCLATHAAEKSGRHPLDPRGQIHLPIGIPDAVDALKTFVEAEGNFSPGFGTYGIYWWVWDDATKRLYAPTMDDVPCEHGLAPGGLLIPWSKWLAGEVEVKTEVCQVKRGIPYGPFLGENKVTGRLRHDGLFVGARVHLRNLGERPAKVSLYVALRPLGPAGGPIKELSAGVFDLQVEQRVALHACFPVNFLQEARLHCGVLSSDHIGDWALRGAMPTNRLATSASGDCSGALACDVGLAPGQVQAFGFVCPVLPARRAAGHRWDGVNPWAQFDLNRPDSTADGVVQPTLELRDWGQPVIDDLFAEAAADWSNLQHRVRIQLPDPRWAESFAAIVGHAAMCLNEGAPDVAVVNYNVFNRDGMYVANIFQKSGNFALAEAAIDYFLKHPFNGRVQPEADNPGQILWIMGEHWKFTRNRDWLARVYPGAQKLAAMIRYCRTTPGPHWVWDTRLDFGEALPISQRKELKPGACDGFNPSYTEAYDIAGLRAAVVMAEALSRSGSGDADDDASESNRALASAATKDAAAWGKLADTLFTNYEKKFGADLPKGYGSYSVLWPCRLYPFTEGHAFEQFRKVGAQWPADWRYFPLARAHQGLLTGNRAAASETLDLHLDHPQMQGWYAFDEGGPSGVGGWHHVRTTWPIERDAEGTPKSTVAMPHGWALAEFHLLLRDALLFEDGDRLVLLPGVPPGWFRHPAGMQWVNLPTHFGPCSLAYTVGPAGATLQLDSASPGGAALRLPPDLKVRAQGDGQALRRIPSGDVLVPPRVRKVELEFE